MSIQQPSRRKAILRAIAQIVNAAGSTEDQAPAAYTGYKLYAPPTSGQIAQYGTPYFYVQRATLAGYSPDGETISVDLAHAMGGSSQPVWDFVVASFHPFDQETPNYDDADDDAEIIRLAIQDASTLPYTTSVQATPAPTTGSFTVDPGTGRFLSPYREMILGTEAVMPMSIVGDLVTLASTLLTPPTPGVQASQGTCYNSYPYNVQPDYAEVSDGTPYCVGYAIVRAFEDLVVQLP